MLGERPTRRVFGNMQINLAPGRTQNGVQPVYLYVKQFRHPGLLLEIYCESVAVQKQQCRRTHMLAHNETI